MDELCVVLNTSSVTLMKNVEWPIGNLNNDKGCNVIQVGFLSGLSMFSPGQALLSIGDKKIVTIFLQPKTIFQDCMVLPPWLWLTLFWISGTVDFTGINSAPYILF